MYLIIRNFIIIISVIFYTTNQIAEEILIYADKIDYDFEKKLYKVNMFNKDESIKIKLIK